MEAEGSSGGEQAAVELTGAMERTVARLWGLLRESSGVGLVGVQGTAGTGKTVLLNALRPKLEEERMFFIVEREDWRKVITLRLGREHMDIKRIQAKILKELEEDELQGSCEDEKKLAENIFCVTTEKRKCIFLFDDVGDELPLSSIGIPNPSIYSHLCKVVFASRNSELCSGADETIDLTRISDPWELFLSGVGWASNLGVPMSFTGVAIEPYLKSRIGTFPNDMVEACDGLPLALLNAGKVLSSVFAEMEELARTIKREPWAVPEIAENVLSVLKQNYDGLSSDALRVCLMYFAMYPKETTILKEWFTDYWIGEGIITDFATMEEAHGKREQLVVQLEKAGLVSDMKLQNMVRAMVSWANLTPPALLALPEANLTEAPEEEKWNSAGRISLVKNEISEWPEEPNCPHLKALLLWSTVKNENFPGGFFQSMRSLKVLDLSRCCLERLPGSIGELSALQFLDLSYSTNLRSLPKEMENLRKLRFLSLYYCQSLTEIPYGIFGVLTELKILRMFVSFSNWDVAADGAKIEELHNLTSLVELDIVVESMASFQDLMTWRHLRESLRNLGLYKLNGTRTLQLPRDLGQGLTRLHRVGIYDCSDLEELALGVSEGEGAIESFRCVDTVALHKARLRWGDTTMFEELNLSGIGQIEELVPVAESSSGPFLFPNLKLLYLVSMPALTRVCRAPLKLPSLRTLWVGDCPGLAKLPFGMHSGQSLEIIMGSTEWWEALDWGLGGHVLKSKFQPLFVSE